jgi:hypothetical protein
MQSIINVEPSKLYAFNLEMVNSSRMDISQYFKIVDSKFYLQADNENKVKDSSDRGRTSDRDHDILDTKERTEFIDYFVRLVKTPFDFCVSHEEFQKYGVVGRTKGVTLYKNSANTPNQPFRSVRSQ